MHKSIAITDIQRHTLGIKVVNANLARAKALEAAGSLAPHLLRMREYPFDAGKTTASLIQLDITELQHVLNHPVVPETAVAAVIFDPSFDEAHKRHIPVSLLLSFNDPLAAFVWNIGYSNYQEMFRSIASRIRKGERAAMKNVLSDRNLSKMAQTAIGNLLAISPIPMQSAPLDFDLSTSYSDALRLKRNAVKAADNLLHNHSSSQFALHFTQYVRKNGFSSLDAFLRTFCSDTIAQWAMFLSRDDMPADVCAGLMGHVLSPEDGRSSPDIHFSRRLLLHEKMKKEKAGAILAEMGEEISAAILLGLADDAVRSFTDIADGRL